MNALGVQSADDAALGLPPANIRVTAGLRGHTADVDARLDAGSASQLTALGRAPLAADGEVDMKINGKVDVGLMNAFLEARGQHASGQLDIDATVTGDVAAPQITGTLDLKNGKINDYGARRQPDGYRRANRRQRRHTANQEFHGGGGAGHACR